MSCFTRSFFNFLKPTYYIPESDKQLQASVQKILYQEGSHMLAVVQAVRTIALATFINAPYYLSKATINLFVNCIHLDFTREVWGNYKKGAQNLTYSAVAAVYVTIGVFNSSVLKKFRIGLSKNIFTSTENTDITRSSDCSLRGLLTENSSESTAADSQSLNSWEVVCPEEVGPAGINNNQIIRKCGSILEIQGFRIALNEYARVLREDFSIDLHEKLTEIQNWLKIPDFQNDEMIKTLKNTLTYLLFPIDVWATKEYCYSNAKEQREAYVRSLREVLATEQYQRIRKKPNLCREHEVCLRLIRAMCLALFLSERHEFLKKLLHLHEREYDRIHANPKEIPAVTRENFNEVVMAKNTKVHESPSELKIPWIDRNKRMLYGAVGVEDFLMRDVSFLRGKQVFIDGNNKERFFYYMRHPTPHMPNSLIGTALRIFSLGYIESGEVIAPEFEGMLEAIAEQGNSYLIQSHQRLNDSGMCENEDMRSQTLYRLQKSHPNFHVVFQGVEGALFERNGPYAGITTFTELKKAIKNSFYDRKGPNRLPRLIEDDVYYRETVIDDLLNQVHQKIFGNRVDISFAGRDPTESNKSYPNREWQEFILAFYIFQGDDLKFRLPNVKYFSTNCKNFFDRGGNRAMAEDRIHQEMSQRKITPECLNETIINLVPIPLHSKGKGVITHRLRSGLALSETLANFSSKQRQGLQEVSFNGYKSNRFEISKKPDQKVIPLCKDMQTLQEVQTFLKALEGEHFYVINNDIVEENWSIYRDREKRHLFYQVDGDLRRSDVFVNNIQFKGIKENDAEKILKILSEMMSEELALKVLAQLQQGIFAVPCKTLSETFQSDALGLHVFSSRKRNTVIQVTTIGDRVEIHAQDCLRYQVANGRDQFSLAFFNIEVAIVIPKNGKRASAHWSWNIVGGS